MDALFAFDNAVERLLEVSPTEPLPEQLAKLRFLFEEEFDTLLLYESTSLERIGPCERAAGGRRLSAGCQGAPRCRSSRATWRRGRCARMLPRSVKR